MTIETGMGVTYVRDVSPIGDEIVELVSVLEVETVSDL